MLLLVHIIAHAVVVCDCKWEFQWLPQSGSFIRCFQVKLEFGKLGFCVGEGKLEKPSVQGWEPTTNSTHIWRRDRESNPGHIGWTRVLPPLCHTCSPNCHRLHENRAGKRLNSPPFLRLIKELTVWFFFAIIVRILEHVSVQAIQKGLWW